MEHLLYVLWHDSIKPCLIELAKLALLFAFFGAAVFGAAYGLTWGAVEINNAIVGAL